MGDTTKTILLLPFIFLCISFAAEAHDPTAYSMEVYTKRIKKNPADWQAWRDRGGIYRIQCRYELAEQDLKKALALAPNEAFTLKELGAVECLGRENYKACLEYLERAFKAGLQPDDLRNAYSLRWKCHRKLGMEQEALEDLNSLINLGEAPANLYIARGKAKMAMGEEKEALDDFETAHNRNPFLLENVERIVEMNLKFGRTEKALAIAKEAVQKNDEEVRFCHLLAGVYERLGKKEEAGKERQRALRKAQERVKEYPEGPWPLTERARAFLGLGKAKEAIEDLNKVIETFPDEESYTLRSEAYQMAGNPKLAEADRRAAERIRLEDHLSSTDESSTAGKQAPESQENPRKEKPAETMEKAGGPPEKQQEGKAEKGPQSSGEFPLSSILLLGGIGLLSLVLLLVYLIRRR